MADTRFREKKPMINAFAVSDDDPEFLRPREFTFLFFTSSVPRARLLYDKHENYQQGTIQFSELMVTATEYMSRPCVHCKQGLTSVGDCCVAVNQGQVVAVVHESCFRQWFNSSDKGQLSPYRLVRARRQKMAVEGSSFKVQINNGTPVDEYTFSALHPVELEELAHDQMTGTIVQQGSGGYTGTPPQGIAPDDYMLQMSTLVQGNERPPQQAAPADQGVTTPPWQVNSPAAPASPAVSHAVKVDVNCPHCSAKLTISIEHKPE